MTKQKFENLNLSFNQNNLLLRLKKKDKENLKKKKLESIKSASTIKTSRNNGDDSSLLIPPKRGRKATGSKTVMISLTLSQSFHKKLEALAEKREDAIGKTTSIQKVIKEILIEHIESLEQLRLFQEKL